MSNIISADVSDDLKDRIEAAREDGESRSAAVKRLIRAGLDGDSGNSLGIGYGLIWAGSAFLFVTVEWSLQTIPADAMAVVGILLMTAGAIYGRLR